ALGRSLKIAIKREVTRDPAPQGIIDQLDTQGGMVFELARRTRHPLLKATPFDRIVRARRTHVIRDQVIIGNDVALVGMIPESADVLNQLALMIHQSIIDGNNTPAAVAGLRRLL